MNIVLLKSNNLSNNISIMVNSTIKKTVRGGVGKLHDLILEMFAFTDITLEADLYNTTIYGRPDPNTQQYNLCVCILNVLLNGIDPSKYIKALTKERYEEMIRIINSFIKEFNEDNDENINNISSNIDTNDDGTVTISNEQKREVLNLICNQKVMSKISNLSIASDLKDKKQVSNKIANMKRFQESFKQELTSIKAEK